MTQETNDGRRLRVWRESLPRARKSPIATRSLADALGWDGARWWWLERCEEWTAHQRDEVAAGVRAVAERLDVAAEVVDACVDHVLRGAPAPQLGPWRDGQCPAKPRGRRPGLRSRSADSGEEPQPDARLVRRVVAILRTQAAGHLDEEEAAAAIVDMISGRAWNSSMQSHPAAA